MRSGINKFKVFFIGVYLLVAVLADLQGQDSSTQKAIDDLGSKDPDRCENAVKFISSKGTDALPELLAHFYPDLDQAIADLGNEEFDVRKKATDLLKQRGRACSDKITKRYQESKDPEVRMRCREIIDSFKVAISEDKQSALLNAYRIVFRDGIPVEKALPFYEEFFKSFSLLTSGKDALLQSALKQIGTDAKYSHFISKALPEIKDKEPFEIFANALFVADPSSVPAILKRIEEGNFSVDELETRLLRTKEARSTVLERVVNNRNINCPFANSLWNIHNFDKIYKDDVKVFLGSPQPDVQAMGLRLISENPEPYIDFIMGIVRKSQEDGTQAGTYNHFFSELEKVSHKEIFLPHLDEFLKSKDPSAMKFAADIAGDNIDSYADKILKSIPQDNEYYAGRIVDSILEKNPGKRDAVEKYFVELLKKCNHRDMDKIFPLSKILREKLKCDDADFDAWWKKIAEDFSADGEIKNREWNLIQLLHVADNLNVKTETIFPYLDMASLGYDNRIAGKFMKSGLKEKFLEKMLESLRNPGDHDYSGNFFFADVLKADPDLFPVLIMAYMDGMKKLPKPDLDTLCQHGNYNIVKLGNSLYANPKYCSLLLPYLNDKDEKNRFIAAWILALGGFRDGTLHDILLEFGKSNQQKGVQKKLLHMIFLSECPVEGIKDIAIKILLEQERYYELDEILNGLPIASRKYLPILTEVVRKFRDGAKHENACFVAKYVLEADSENKETNEYLCNLVLKDSDAKAAENALRALKYFGTIPEIPADRWEYLYRKSESPDSFNEFVSTRPENLKNALPAIVRNLNLFVGAYEPLGDILWKNPEVQKVILPEFLKMAGNGDLKARRMVFEEFCSSSEELANHPDLLLKFLEVEKDESCLTSLIWAIANVGLPAANAVPLLEQKMKDASCREYCIFALSCISPEKEKRLQHVRTLIEILKGDAKDKSSSVRMLGLVSEFEDIIQPELEGLLFADEGKCNYTHDQAIYGLARKKPYTDRTIETLRKILERNIDLAPGETESCMSAVFWCLNDCPSEGVKLLPLLEKMNFRKQRESGTRDTIVRLRRIEKK